MASQKKNLILGGTEAFQMSLAPGKAAMPMKNARYADEAVYLPNADHFHTNLSAMCGES